MLKLKQNYKIIITLIIMAVLAVFLYFYLDDLTLEFLKKSDYKLDDEEILELKHYLAPLYVSDFVKSLEIEVDKTESYYLYDKEYKLILRPQSQLDYSLDVLEEIELDYQENPEVLKSIIVANKTKIKEAELDELVQQIDSAKLTTYDNYGLKIQVFTNKLVKIKRKMAY